ncbi:Zn-ribbon containing protein [Methanonatronarchaeum thermophilum]|uniref:Zn-ribbon containing protein n=1 Tax=Methanonatronarchaeum thermophilum TaxID=1927129 RepID=A0A1Y3GBR9_9EURY|nr:Zn-ribbon containing protein [Methanonatronarchaeum thermophilum]OUJ18690.1 Zn-ribbon containing protein [Methanonatronarchaeum thermophilum]
MPHECTRCQEIYPNGSEEILSGCPNCSWNRFRYLTKEQLEDGETPPIEDPEGEEVKREPEEEKERKEELLDISGFTWERKQERISLKELEEIEKIASTYKKGYKNELTDNDVESLRIKGDGSFEINLKSLIEEKGIVISIGEDGKYIIDLDSFLKK